MTPSNLKANLTYFARWSLNLADALKAKISPRQAALDKQLFGALVEADPRLIAQAIELGANPNACISKELRSSPNLPKKFYGWPLEVTVRAGSIECTLALLRGGADPWRCPTVIHMAANAGNVEMIQVLADHGADMNGFDGEELGDGKTPFLRAVSLGHLGAMDTLLKLGADPHITVAENKESEAAKNSAIHLACESNRPDIVARLLSLGCDPSTKNDEGNCPGHLAARHADGRCLGVLIAAGVPLNTWGRHGMTMAMVAATRDAIIPLSLLHEAGADFSLKQSPGERPLLVGKTAKDYALAKDSTQALAFFASLEERLDLQGVTLGSPSVSQKSRRI